MSQPAAEQPPLGRLLDVYHTGFTVADIERSIRFYRDQLGMVLVHRQEGSSPYTATLVGFPGVHLKIAFLKAAPEAHHVLELLEYTSHPAEANAPETNRPGNGHFALRVTDIDGLYRDLSAQGVHFVSPPQLITAGVHAGVRACYLRDPDGFSIELMQFPEGRHGVT